MQGSTIVKLLIVVAVVFAIWKYGLPWYTAHQAPKTEGEVTTPATNCLFAARQANDYWGSNISQFANNIDRAAWDNFKSIIEKRIVSAESKCFCNDDACTRAKSAMAELRSLANDWDRAVISGAPLPADSVQRKESIDNVLNQ